MIKRLLQTPKHFGRLLKKQRSLSGQEKHGSDAREALEAIPQQEEEEEEEEEAIP